jgi:hypothetical protein
MTSQRSSVTAAVRGTSVRATLHKTAPTPTAAQRRLLRQGMARSMSPGPDAPIYQGPIAQGVGPGVTAPTAGSGKSPRVVTAFRNTLLPAGGLKSPVNEPSTDANGRFVFQTGNWYAARSTNSGGAWTYLDPFTLFGSGFCCDQVTVLDLSHNRQFWLLQFNNRLVIANSAGTTLSSWCFYNWTPGQFGLTGAFDYNHMAVSTSFLYVSTNSSGGALVFRIPIATQIACGSVSATFLVRSQDFSDAFVQSAQDTMYWGTASPTDVTRGSNFRILRWADNSNSIFAFTRAIDPFVYMFFGGSQNCSGPNVLNWCQRTDSRLAGGGYIATQSLGQASSKGTLQNETVIGFAVNSNTSAGGHPYPFIRRYYFRAIDLTYLGFTELFCTNCAILYPDMAPDSRGHIGMVWAFGGGTSNTFPGAGVLIDDDLSPNQPWDVSFFLSGAGNPCLNTADNRRRWGDYLTVRPWSPTRYLWVATAFSLAANAGSCSSTASVNVANIVFGHSRDSVAYTRWRV